jgi:hypothetical protein
MTFLRPETDAATLGLSMSFGSLDGNVAWHSAKSPRKPKGTANKEVLKETLDMDGERRRKGQRQLDQMYAR